MYTSLLPGHLPTRLSRQTGSQGVKDRSASSGTTAIWRHQKKLCRDHPRSTTRPGPKPPSVLANERRAARVQQRLKQVMLRTLDEGHLDRGPPQRPGGEQAREAAADDHDPAPAVLIVHYATSLRLWRRELGRVTRPRRARRPGRAAAGPLLWDPSCPWRRGGWAWR